jgi:hypothetical protein
MNKSEKDMRSQKTVTPSLVSSSYSWNLQCLCEIFKTFIFLTSGKTGWTTVCCGTLLALGCLSVHSVFKLVMDVVQ